MAQGNISICMAMVIGTIGKADLNIMGVFYNKSFNFAKGESDSAGR